MFFRVYEKNFNFEMLVFIKNKNKLFIYFHELNKVINNFWLFSNLNINKVYTKILFYTYLF